MTVLKITPLWSEVDARPRLSMATLRKSDISDGPGVCALYRGKFRVYVGESDSLQRRIWKEHASKRVSMTDSALRRNVAEFLGIASAADIKARRYMPTLEEVTKVHTWLDACDITWIECKTKHEALDLKNNLKAEFMPCLRKR